MDTPRRIIAWVSCFAVVWLAFCTLIGIFGVEGALHPARRPLLEADRTLAQSIAVSDHARLTDVSVRAEDGAILRAWVIVPAVGNRDAVILLHGQADNRAGMLGNAHMLLRHGYMVLLTDARAQGSSDGLTATYGAKEAGDLRRWFEWLRSTLAPHCIDGLGDSMGAAILLQSAAVEPRFCAIVAESSFSSFREASYDRIGQWFGAGPWLGRSVLRPALTFGFAYAALRYGVDLERVSPASAVADTRIPILLIHGLADTNLPPRHSESIEAGNPAVVLWEPVNAGHCGASTASPAEYEHRVLDWLESH